MKLPFPRDLLIDAARQRARGVSWALIAAKTPHSEGDLVTFTLDQPEIWGPLYARAEKLRLQESEGQGLAHLTALLKGDAQVAAEKAGRELLIHRRHIERRRRRYEPQRHRDTESHEGLNAVGGSGNAGLLARDLEESSVPQCLCGEKEVPEELKRPMTYAANRVAHGEDYASMAAEVGRSKEEIARWAFIYPRTWDRVYPQARLAAAQFAAALAINRLLDFAAGPDAGLAARAGRTLLVHRRHMHWAQTNQPRARVPESAGEGAGTYPPSVTQVSAAIGGDGSLTVARRSGPARSSGAVRSSARPRDGPG